MGINLNSEEIAALVSMLRLLGIHVLRLKLLKLHNFVRDKGSHLPKDSFVDSRHPSQCSESDDSA